MGGLTDIWRSSSPICAVGCAAVQLALHQHAATVSKNITRPQGNPPATRWRQNCPPMAPQPSPQVPRGPRLAKDSQRKQGLRPLRRRNTGTRLGTTLSTKLGTKLSAPWGTTLDTQLLVVFWFLLGTTSGTMPARPARRVGAGWRRRGGGR